MTEPMAYIGRAACGCIRVAVVDDPEHRGDVADTVSNCILRGMAVERVTCEAVRTAKWDCAKHAKDAEQLEATL